MVLHTFYFVEKNYKCYDKYQQNTLSDNAMWLKLWDEKLHEKSCTVLTQHYAPPSPPPYCRLDIATSMGRAYN